MTADNDHETDDSMGLVSLPPDCGKSPGRYGRDDFPPYAYIPGDAPHPIRSPQGHMHGVSRKAPPAIEGESWRENEEWLNGVDLYNNGYFWEAHESWESLWHVMERRGPVADLLKGLIQISAAQLKIRQGQRAGVRTLSSRGAGLIQEVRGQVGDGFMGVSLDVFALEAAAWFGCVLEEGGGPGQFPFISLDW